MSFTALLAGKLAASFAIGAVGVSGAAGVAYAGALPEPLQNTAHGLIGAPAADDAADDVADDVADGTAGDGHAGTPAPESEPAEVPEAPDTEVEDGDDVPTTTPTTPPSAPTDTAAPGPDATGPAAYGVCNAFNHGGLGTASTAYRSLVLAAGGDAAKVTAYCATVPHPGSPESEPLEAPEADSPATAKHEGQAKGSGKTNQKAKGSGKDKAEETAKHDTDESGDTSDD